MKSSVREISVSGYIMTSLIIPRKISIRNAFAPLLFWSLSFMPWDHALFVKEHQRNTWNKRKWRRSLQRRERSAESEFNGCVQRFFDVFWMQWSLNFCTFQVCNNFFLVLKKLLQDTRVNLLVVYSNKIYMHDSSYARPLKSVRCVISAPLLVHCVSVSYSKLIFGFVWFGIVRVARRCNFY